jgi:hypothetical protein
MAERRSAPSTMIPAIEALVRLRDGNRRFVVASQTTAPALSGRAALVVGQEPFAIVLGCSDSRASPRNWSSTKGFWRPFRLIRNEGF